MKKIILLFVLFFNLYLFAEVALAIVENNTVDGHYKYFGQADQIGAFYVAPLSSKTALDFTNIEYNIPITISDIKGNNPHINMKLGNGVASGSCSTDTLPGFIELWTGSPSEIDANKVLIRYCLKDASGYFGLRIKADGSPVLFPVDGIEFLDTEFIVNQK